jgi:hypothetical protein
MKSRANISWRGSLAFSPAVTKTFVAISPQPLPASLPEVDPADVRQAALG